MQSLVQGIFDRVEKRYVKFCLVYLIFGFELIARNALIWSFFHQLQKLTCPPKKKTFFSNSIFEMLLFSSRTSISIHFLGVVENFLAASNIKRLEKKTNKSLKIHFLTDSSFSSSCLHSNCFISSPKNFESQNLASLT
jgi:hypothetical protein